MDGYGGSTGFTSSPSRYVVTLKIRLLSVWLVAETESLRQLNGSAQWFAHSGCCRGYTCMRFRVGLTLVTRWASTPTYFYTGVCSCSFSCLKAVGVFSGFCAMGKQHASRSSRSLVAFQCCLVSLAFRIVDTAIETGHGRFLSDSSFGISGGRSMLCQRDSLDLWWAASSTTLPIADMGVVTIPSQCRFCLTFERNAIEKTSQTCLPFVQRGAKIDNLPTGVYNVHGAFDLSTCLHENMPSNITLKPKSVRFEVSPCALYETQLGITIEGAVDRGNYYPEAVVKVSYHSQFNPRKHDQGMTAVLDGRKLISFAQPIRITTPGLHTLEILSGASSILLTRSFVVLENNSGIGLEEWGLPTSWFSPSPYSMQFRSDDFHEVPILFALAPKVNAHGAPVPIIICLRRGFSHLPVWETLREGSVRVRYRQRGVSAWENRDVSVFRGYGNTILPPGTVDVLVQVIGEVAPRLATRRLHIRHERPIAGETLNCPEKDPHRRLFLISESLTVPSQQAFDCSGLAGATFLFGEAVDITAEPNAQIVFGGGGASEPIVLSSLTNGSFWGGFYLVGSSSTLHASWTVFALSGGMKKGTTFTFGHHNKKPMIMLVDGASASLEHCFLIQGAGPAFGANRGGKLILSVTLVQGFTMGVEAEHSILVVDNSHLGTFGSLSLAYNMTKSPSDGDFDGIYVTGGKTIITRSVVRAAGDDCIDSGSGSGGIVNISNSIIESCRHEGLAWSNDGPDTKTVHVTDTVIRDCQQAVELGCSTLNTNIVLTHSVITDSLVGIRRGDNNAGCSVLGSLQTTRSVIARCEMPTLDLHHSDWGPSAEGSFIVEDSLIHAIQHPTAPGNELLDNLYEKFGKHVTLSKSLRNDILPPNQAPAFDNVWRLLPGEFAGYRYAADSDSRGKRAHLDADMLTSFLSDVGQYALGATAEALKPVRVVVVYPEEGECILTSLQTVTVVVQLESVDHRFTGVLHAMFNGQDEVSVNIGGDNWEPVVNLEINLHLVGEDQLNMLSITVFDAHDGALVASTISTFCMYSAKRSVSQVNLRSRAKAMSKFYDSGLHPTLEQHGTPLLPIVRLKLVEEQLTQNLHTEEKVYDAQFQRVGQGLGRCGQQSFLVNSRSPVEFPGFDRSFATFLLMAICPRQGVAKSDGNSEFPLLAYRSSLKLLSSIQDLFLGIHSFAQVTFESSGKTSVYLMVEGVVSAVSHKFHPSFVIQRTNSGNAQEYLGFPRPNRFHDQRTPSERVVSFEALNAGIEISTTGFAWKKDHPKEPKAETRGPLLDVAEIVRSLRGARMRKQLRSLVNMTQYISLMAFNSLLLNADTVDEVFFYQKTASFPMSVMGWDFDDVLGNRCESMDTAFRDPLLFCSTAALDMAVASDEVFREELRGHLLELMNGVLSNKNVQRVVNSVAQELCKAISDIGSCDRIKAAVNEMIDLIAYRQAFLRVRLDHEEGLRKDGVQRWSDSKPLLNIQWYRQCQASRIVGVQEEGLVDELRRKLKLTPISSVRILDVQTAGVDELHNNLTGRTKGFVTFVDGSHAALKVMTETEAISQLFAIALETYMGTRSLPASVYRRLTAPELDALPSAIKEDLKRIVPGNEPYYPFLTEWRDGVCDSALLCGTRQFHNEFYYRANHLPSFSPDIIRKSFGNACPYPTNLTGTTVERIQWTETGVFDYILGSTDRCKLVHWYKTTRGFHDSDFLGTGISNLRQCQNVHVQMTEDGNTLLNLDHDKSWLTVARTDAGLSKTIHVGHTCTYPAELARKLFATLPPTKVQRLYDRGKGKALFSTAIADIVDHVLDTWVDDDQLKQTVRAFGPRIYKIMDAQVEKLVQHLQTCIKRQGLHKTVCAYN